MNLGIALGGGGAKGLAHIGILEALEQNGIKPKFVAGTSIGSIIGAIYCLYGTAKGLQEKAKQMIESEEFKHFQLDRFYTNDENVFERFKKEVFEKFFFGQLLFKKSHVKIEAAKKLFNGLFSNKTFADLKIAFACNALDIQSGEETVFTSGPITDAVWPSCAIPGILPPFVKDKKIFVDGGVVDNVPIEPVKRIGAKIVLAVYLGDRPKFSEEPDTGYKITQRSLSFMRYHFDQRILRLADFVLNPEVAKFHWADFSAMDELVQKGREAVIKNIKEIEKLISFWCQLKKLIRR